MLASSEGAVWADLLVEIVTRRRVQERLLIPAVAEPLVVWVVSGRAAVEGRDDETPWTGREVCAGDFFLTTTPTPYELRWRAAGPDDFVVMHVYLSLPLMARVQQGADGLRGYAPRLSEVSGGRDDTLSALLELLRAELTADVRHQRWFVGGIAQSLAAHLTHTYAVADQVTPKQTGGLPAFRLHKVTELLAAHLAENLPLARLAEAAGYSPFHFSRLFKKATGLSPSRYLIGLRMERARQLLRETTLSIIEVGLEVGYTNPSHFAQLFRREVGSAPGDYRGRA